LKCINYAIKAIAKFFATQYSLFVDGCMPLCSFQFFAKWQTTYCMFLLMANL